MHRRGAVARQQPISRASSRRAPRLTPTHETAATRYTAPLLLAAALFVAAGGFVHLREWLDTYRQVPASAAGAAVVRIGFPVNAATSVVVALALAFVAIRRMHVRSHVVVAAILFQAGSLAALILTRTGSLLGWTEPIWTLGADQSRAVEIGALISLTTVLAVAALQRRVPGRGGPRLGPNHICIGGLSAVGLAAGAAEVLESLPPDQ